LINISFSKYGKVEFEKSGLTPEELEESVEKTMQKRHMADFVYCEPIAKGDAKWRPNGTILSEDRFLLQSVSELRPRKIEQEGKTEIVWEPKVEGPTAKEYFISQKKAKNS
jgi:hypothetical protein